MMNRAAVSAALFLTAIAANAYADEGATETTTAGTLVVVTPNAPIVITNGHATQTQAPALAPPGEAESPPMRTASPAGPAAPQNESWNNVSHINGTPIPVGQRTDYLYATKKTNISTNPIGWMFGYYQIAGSRALSQNLAVNVELTAWSYSSGYHQGYQLAATLPIYFRKTFSGPFLEGGLVIHNDKQQDYLYSSSCYDCSSASNTWAGPEVMLGWSWIFDSGLNLSFAFGAAKKMTTNDSMSYSSDEPVPAGYFRVGYAF